MNMAKLSIKGLIESALNLGRTLDSDYAPLQQFFVVMEHCLKHGLKSKRNKSQPKFHCPQCIHRSSFVSFTQWRCNHLLINFDNYCTILLVCCVYSSLFSVFFLKISIFLGKKTFLGQNKSFWGPLELVEKLTPEAGEITASVKDLPGLK